MAQEFRVIAYNTHLFVGTAVEDWNNIKEFFGKAKTEIYRDEDRFEAIKEKIAGCDADIVGLSEVWANSFQDGMMKACENAGYNGGYAFQQGSPVKISSGLVLISRKSIEPPVRFKEYSNLVGDDYHSEKGIVSFVGDRAVRIIQTHTQASWRGDHGKGERARWKGINKELRDELETVLKGTPEPVILLGDLNIAADGQDYERFRRLMEDEGMKDVWTALNGSKPGLTYVPGENELIQRFAPDDHDAHRLDYIFYRAEDRIIPTNQDIEKIKPKSAEVLKWTTDDGVEVSDHYGLSATFEFADD